MIEKRIIPVLTIKNGQLVKTIRFKKPKYIGDPINAVKIFNEKEVDEICILDITASIAKKEPNFKKIEEIANECFMPLAYGGGISSFEHVEKLFKIGIEKVIINSALLNDNIDFIRRAGEVFGEQSILLSLDIRKKMFGGYQIMHKSGTVSSKYSINSIGKLIDEVGFGELVINNIDNDGVMMGMSSDLIDTFSKITSLPIISTGGIGNIDHIKEVFNKTSVDAIGCGSMFIYHGKLKGILINYPNKELEHIR